MIVNRWQHLLIVMHIFTRLKTKQTCSNVLLSTINVTLLSLSMRSRWELMFRIFDELFTSMSHDSCSITVKKMNVREEMTSQVKRWLFETEQKKKIMSNSISISIVTESISIWKRRANEWCWIFIWMTKSIETAVRWTNKRVKIVRIKRQWKRRMQIRYQIHQDRLHAKTSSWTSSWLVINRKFEMRKQTYKSCDKHWIAYVSDVYIVSSQNRRKRAIISCFIVRSKIALWFEQNIKSVNSEFDVTKRWSCTKNVISVLCRRNDVINEEKRSKQTMWRDTSVSSNKESIVNIKMW